MSSYETLKLLKIVITFYICSFINISITNTLFHKYKAAFEVKVVCVCVCVCVCVYIYVRVLCAARGAVGSPSIQTAQHNDSRAAVFPQRQYLPFCFHWHGRGATLHTPSLPPSSSLSSPPSPLYPIPLCKPLGASLILYFSPLLLAQPSVASLLRIFGSITCKCHSNRYCTRQLYSILQRRHLYKLYILSFLEAAFFFLQPFAVFETYMYYYYDRKSEIENYNNKQLPKI